MRKHSFLSIVVIVIILAVSTPVNALAAKLPTPCIGSGPEVYLVIDGTRRHIVDWDTFLNLGYTSSDIISCGAAASFAEGAPITRLFKGSDDAIYLMQSGVRRHIPDLITFSAMGFQTSDITILPDAVLSLWPLGNPLQTATIAFNGNVYKEVKVGNYTIQVWHPAQAGLGLDDFATFKLTDGSTIEITEFASLGQLPATDINGDGTPDVAFVTHGLVGWGTTVYSLGADPRAILSIESIPTFGAKTGQGSFVDLNKDGVYEFVTHDALPGIGCPGATVTAVLKYDAAQGRYVGASPSFPAYYADTLAKLTAQTKAGNMCDIYPLITTLAYMGKTSDAQSAFDNLFEGRDLATGWRYALSAIQQGRFYTAGS